MPQVFGHQSPPIKPERFELSTTQRLGLSKIQSLFRDSNSLSSSKQTQRVFSFRVALRYTKIWQFYKSPIFNRRYISKWFVRCSFSRLEMPIVCAAPNQPLPRLDVDSSRPVGRPAGFKQLNMAGNGKSTFSNRKYIDSNGGFPVPC